MKILHYSLGPSPYRCGGLTRYCDDLMKSQRFFGHNVSLLYPAGVRIFSSQMKIIRKRKNGICYYRIDNPMPVPLYHGIKVPREFYDEQGYDDKKYSKLLDEVQPDVIHLHTLMGLTLSFLKLVRKRDIKVVYTTHDYFGLCLKTNFIDIANRLCSSATPERCTICNQNAKSKLFLRFRNEPCIIALKNILKKSLKSQVGNLGSNVSEANQGYNNADVFEYGRLMDYYREMFTFVDEFHFNSILTKEIYAKYLPDIKGQVIPITNSSIDDHRVIKQYGEELKICFIGSLDTFKGFNVLKSVLLKLKDQNWSLNVWGSITGIDSDCERIHYKGRYLPAQLKDIYDSCDLVVVPSLWYETFSFVTLEALSYGTPVIVSDHVGAQDLVKQYNPNFVFSTKDELQKLLGSLMRNKEPLVKFNRSIVSMEWRHDMRSHANEIEKKIYR